MIKPVQDIVKNILMQTAMVKLNDTEQLYVEEQVNEFSDMNLNVPDILKILEISIMHTVLIQQQIMKERGK